MSAATPGEVTELLDQLSAGDSGALDRLVPLVYSELREMAARCMRRETPGRTLQPTALVHEAYFRLVGQNGVHWQNRDQFFSIAALVMRRILISYARRRNAQKRGGQACPVTFDESLGISEQAFDEVLSVDEALIRLAKLDPAQARVVELRYFGGLSVEETAQVLGVSPITVKREWRSARVWLRRQLSKGIGHELRAMAAGETAV